MYSENPPAQMNSTHFVVTSFDFFIDSTAQIKALSGQVPRKTREKTRYRMTRSLIYLETMSTAHAQK